MDGGSSDGGGVMDAAEADALRAEVAGLRAEVARLKARCCPLHPDLTGAVLRTGDPVCTCDPRVPSSAVWIGDPPGGWNPTTTSATWTATSP